MVLIDQLRTRVFDSSQQPTSVPLITLALPADAALEDSRVLQAAIEFAWDVMAFASVELHVCEHLDHTPVHHGENRSNV